MPASWAQPQPVADFLEDGELFDDRRGRAPVDHRRERLSRDVLHRDERPVVVFTGVEYGDDVGVVELAGGADFAREALPHGLILEALAEQFDGDEAIDGGVTREVEGSHTAMRELARNLVPPDDGGDLGHREGELYQRNTRRGSVRSLGTANLEPQHGTPPLRRDRDLSLRAVVDAAVRGHLQADGVIPVRHVIVGEHARVSSDVPGETGRFDGQVERGGLAASPVVVTPTVTLPISAVCRIAPVAQLPTSRGSPQSHDKPDQSHKLLNTLDRFSPAGRSPGPGLAVADHSQNQTTMTPSLLSSETDRLMT